MLTCRCGSGMPWACRMMTCQWTAPLWPCMDGAGRCALTRRCALPIRARCLNIAQLPTGYRSLQTTTLWPVACFHVQLQGQAAAWLRAMEARAGLRVLRMGQAAYLRDLEAALRTGTPVLLEDVGETLDPALEPLLLKQARSWACLRSAHLAITSCLPGCHTQPLSQMQLPIEHRFSHAVILRSLQMQCASLSDGCFTLSCMLRNAGL